MTTATIVTEHTVQSLRSAVTGDVFLPDSEGYDAAHRGWNLAADQRPAIVVVADSARDVAEAMRFARAHGVRVAP
jgi:FAD/FMN-containing dehydrogenase